jgi:radical SAM superfamily enzyme YgiQ (UPF0313 family)
LSSVPFKACLIRLPAFAPRRLDGHEGPPPLGLAYIAASLRAAGCEVSAVDCVGEGLDEYRAVAADENLLSHGMPIERALDRVPADARLIGFSSMFSMEWPHQRELIRRVRERFPAAFLVIGGEHASAIPEFVLEDCPALDAVAVGEGELTAAELAAALRDGTPVHAVKGLCLRQDGTIIRTPRRERISDLNAIPEPAWDLFPVERYMSAGTVQGIGFGRKMPMLASRGCPYECTFCSNPTMWTPRWLPRSVDALVAEMKRHKQRYGADNFIFYDLTAIVSRPWALEFCRRLIAEDLRVSWQLPDGTRSEAIDPELAELLYRSGCRLMEMAPETGSQEELDRIKKKAKVGRILRSMKAAHDAGISVTANLIFGLPGTTWKDLLLTFGFIARMAAAGVDDISPSLFIPYPGSESFEDLRARGQLSLDDGYFKGLQGNRVFFGGRAPSYCALSPRTLEWSLRLAVALFYGLGFLLRPWRALDFFLAAGRKEYRTRAAGVAVYLLQRRKRLAA